MKILFHSANPLIPSGYGVTTKMLVPRLAQHHEVAISCHAGLYGHVQVWNGIRCLPHSNYPQNYGMDLVEHHAAHFHPDLVISWVDAFVLQADKIRPLPWAAWVPVDSMPLMKRNIEPLKVCKWIIAPTEWGKTAIEKAGLKVDAVIPCAYNPDQFYVMDTPMKERRAELSKLINVEIGGKFLVNVVSANAGSRKNFEAILMAWDMFHKRYPDSMLFLHTDPTGYFFQGENLNDMAAAIGMSTESIYFPPQWEYVVGGIGEDFLNLLYNCSDLHLNACLGEGFGIPILEAQASGCPVLSPSFGAAGEINRCKGMYLTGRSVCSVPGALQSAVHVENLVGELCSCCSFQNSLRDVRARNAVSANVQYYAIDNVLPKWLIFIDTALTKPAS